MGEGPAAMRLARSGPGAVAAVGGEVLGHQDDLAQGRRAAVAARQQRVDLGHESSVAGRERCLPRKDGMAQKPQMRSQPSATLT